MKKIFVDFHHASLLQSFILTFEKRFGWEVYRPIGMDWATKGFWKVYDHPATQAQFLGIGGATPDKTKPLNEVVHKYFEFNELNPNLGDDWIMIYSCQDIDSGLTNKAITFDGFMSIPFDVVIATIPQHIEPFKRLCELHPNKPKLVYQIGNAWNVPDPSLVKNVMASAKVSNVPSHINFIEYHQEFDTTIFKPDESIMPANNIYSFVNCFGIDRLFEWEYFLFQMVEKEMPDWSFKAFGGQCRDGAAHGAKELADKMREARFIWHTKSGGDGYGHVIHNAAAVGRPIITKLSDYSGKLAQSLLIDGVTCINIDNLSPKEVVNKIEYYSLPGIYETFIDNVYTNFKKHVDFDAEAIKIRSFIENLL